MATAGRPLEDMDPIRWVTQGLYGYRLPTMLNFSLNFLGRDWFGAQLKGAEGLTFAHLMLTIYGVQRMGLLMSKKDAMRVINAEHIATTKRYTDLAFRLGMLRIEPSKMDRRVELLVPTATGLRLIEKELAIIRQSMQWAEADIAGEYARASEFQSSITAGTPALEALTLVAEPFGVPTEELGPRDPLTGQRPPAAPRTFARHIAAYSETLRLMRDNVYALRARCLTYMRIREYKKALKDAKRAMELQPDNEHLARRANLYQLVGQYDQAIADGNRLLEDDPENVFSFARLVRARAYAGKGEWRRALEDLDAAIPGADKQIMPLDLVHLRGLINVKLGDLNAALDDLKQAYDKALDDGTSHINVHVGLRADDQVVIDALREAGMDDYVAGLKEDIERIKQDILRSAKDQE